MKNIFIPILFLGFLFACKKETPQADIQVKKDSVVVKNRKNINGIGVVLTPEAAKFVENWEQYQQFDQYVTRYFAISNSEALLSAKELSELSTKLKDSLNYNPVLQDPSVVARFNLLDNECLRLNDMATIPAITPDEVSKQITRILDAYSSVNSKLNSLISIQDYEKELQLDPDFQAILNEIPKDSTQNPLAADKSKKPAAQKVPDLRNKQPLERPKNLNLKKPFQPR